MADGIWVQPGAFPLGGSCFGCGRDNPSGLRLRSFTSGDGVIAEWTPEPHHSNGFEFVSGGVIGSLLDCHTGAALAWWCKQRTGRWPGEPLEDGSGERSPVYLTAGFDVRLLRPTPMTTVALHARVSDHRDPEVTIEGHVECDGKPRAEIVARWRRFQRRT